MKRKKAFVHDNLLTNDINQLTNYQSWVYKLLSYRERSAGLRFITFTRAISFIIKLAAVNREKSVTLL